MERRDEGSREERGRPACRSSSSPVFEADGSPLPPRPIRIRDSGGTLWISRSTVARRSAAPINTGVCGFASSPQFGFAVSSESSRVTYLTPFVFRRMVGFRFAGLLDLGLETRPMSKSRLWLLVPIAVGIVIGVALLVSHWLRIEPSGGSLARGHQRSPSADRSPEKRSTGTRSDEPAHGDETEAIGVLPGSRSILTGSTDVRFETSIDVVHRHFVGSCRGRLSASDAGLSYDAAQGGDGFTTPFQEIEDVAIDYARGNLRVKVRRGRTYNFRDAEDRANRLLLFVQDVELAKSRWSHGAPSTSPD